jgi:hypothetical protein
MDWRIFPRGDSTMRFMTQRETRNKTATSA